MYEFETFAYLDVQKTGSSFISSLLRQYCTEKQVRKVTHGDLPGAYDPAKFYFISVRDPLDQYISLYSFGCQRQGDLFHRMKRSGLAGLYDGTWSGFEFWLAQVLDPLNGSLLDRHYDGPLAGLIGLQSYRVFRLAVPGYLDVTRDCDTPAKLRDVYEAKNIISYVVRYENLREDICTLVRDKLGRSTGMADATEQVRNSPAVNSSDRVDRYERNPRLRARTRRLLAEREWLLNDYFGYGRVAADDAANTSETAASGPSAEQVNGRYIQMAHGAEDRDGSTEELEERVRIAELRAREAEAEIRLLEANAKKMAFTADKKTRMKKFRKQSRDSRKTRGRRKRASDTGAAPETPASEE